MMMMMMMMIMMMMMMAMMTVIIMVHDITLLTDALLAHHAIFTPQDCVASQKSICEGGYTLPV